MDKNQYNKKYIENNTRLFLNAFLLEFQFLMYWKRKEYIAIVIGLITLAFCMTAIAVY